MPPARYQFGPFTVDLGRASLLRGGEAVPLRPKSFDLLCSLLQNAGRVVGKDELMAAVWPGLVVSDDSLARCISEIRAALGDHGQSWIKTVPRRGYMFDAPLDVAAAAPAPADASPRTHARWLSGRRRLVAALAGFAILAGAGLFAIHERVAAPPRLSLVVLPFADLSPGHSQANMADIVTNELTAALSRLRGATIVSGGTASGAGARKTDLRALGAELRVRYALQGSVTADGETLHIDARLGDTASTANLWSDQFDLRRGELPRSADHIVARLANALEVELVRAESRRTASPGGAQIEAEDLALQCEAASLLQQGESGAPSYELCERALQKDPDNVRALVRLALYHGDRVERVQSPDPKADIARARQWIDHALAIDPGFYAAHCANAIVLGVEHRVQHAIAAAERCRELNPTYARAYRLLATFHMFQGRPEHALEDLDAGMRLSPYDPQIGAFLLFRGWAHFGLGDDEEALRWMRRAAAASPDSPSILAPLADVLALTGRDEEAHQTLQKYLSLPRSRARTLAQWQNNPDGNESFARSFERFKSGLRLAGLPER